MKKRLIKFLFLMNKKASVNYNYILHNVPIRNTETTKNIY